MGLWNLGADIEIFIADASNRPITPSMLSATTRKKIKESYADACRLSFDGPHIEMNPEPTTCREAACRKIKAGLNEIRRILAEDKSILVPDYSTERKYTLNTFKKFKDNDKELGCKPSFNTYLKGESKIPAKAKELRFRSAGGHLHFGSANGIWVGKKGTLNSDGYDRNPTYYTLNIFNLPTYGVTLQSEPELVARSVWQQTSLKDRMKFKDVHIRYFTETLALRMVRENVKLMDLFVGIPSTLLERSGADRRRIYGRAGEYRTPIHGLEYRTASSIIIRTPDIYTLFLGWARIPLRICMQNLPKYPDIVMIRNNSNHSQIKTTNKIFKELLKIPDKDIQKAINECDLPLGKKIFDKIINITLENGNPKPSWYSYNSWDLRTIRWFKKKIMQNFPKEYPESQTLNFWKRYDRVNGIVSTVNSTTGLTQKIDKDWSNFTFE